MALRPGLSAERPRGRARLNRRRPPRNVYRRRPPTTEKKKGHFKWLVLLALGAALALGLNLLLLLGYHQVLTSSWFCIKDANDIKIEGLQRISREQILHLAHLGPGASLLAIKPPLVEGALETHPWIARAEFQRKWFSRQIWIRVVERNPVALIHLGELYYVDRRGILFKPTSMGEQYDFPVITGLKKEQIPQDQDKVPEALAQVFQLMDLLKEVKPPLNLANISEIHVDRERGLSLFPSRAGWRVDLGFRDFPEKLTRFYKVWAQLSQKGHLARVGRINLNYSHRVVVTLKTETAAR
jgi:cell division septal protein FtsQ